MTNIGNRVWQLDKKDCVPICESCYQRFKKDKVLKDLSSNPYYGFESETEYRRCWSDQEFCIFCYIYEKMGSEAV